MTNCFISPEFPPIFWPTVAYMLGTSCQIFNISLHAFILLLILLPFLLFLFSQKIVSRTNVIFIIFLLIFFSFGIARYAYLSYHHFKKLEIISGKNVNIIGWISDKESLNKYKTNITIVTDTIENNGIKVNARINIKIYLRKRCKTKIGDKIQINNLNIKQANNKNYEKYLLRDGITATVFIYKQDIKIIERPSFSLNRFIWQIKQRVAKNLRTKINKNTYLLLSSIFLGLKDGNYNHFTLMKKEFNCWGIAHYLARSGLHIALIIIIWTFIFKLLPIPFMLKQLILSCLIIVYSLLSWSSISFYRAFLTFIIYKLYTIKYISIHSTHTLILVCLLILLINPIQLTFIDFQLSFFLTFVLCIFNDLTFRIKKAIA